MTVFDMMTLYEVRVGKKPFTNKQMFRSRSRWDCWRSGARQRDFSQQSQNYLKGKDNQHGHLAGGSHRERIPHIARSGKDKMDIQRLDRH